MKVYFEGFIVLFHAGVDIGCLNCIIVLPKDLPKCFEFPKAVIIAAHMEGTGIGMRLRKFLGERLF